MWQAVGRDQKYTVAIFMVGNIDIDTLRLDMIAQLCPTLCDPMDTRLLRPWDFLGKSIGVGCLFLLQGTSQPRDRTQVSRTVDRHFTTREVWATREIYDSHMYSGIASKLLGSKKHPSLFFCFLIKSFPFRIKFLGCHLPSRN